MFTGMQRNPAKLSCINNEKWTKRKQIFSTALWKEGKWSFFPLCDGINKVRFLFLNEILESPIFTLRERNARWVGKIISWLLGLSHTEKYPQATKVMCTRVNTNVIAILASEVRLLKEQVFLVIIVIIFIQQQKCFWGWVFPLGDSSGLWGTVY